MAVRVLHPVHTINIISMSKITFMSLGLKPDEEKQFKAILKEEDIKGKPLVRRLVRAYIKQRTK